MEKYKHIKNEHQLRSLVFDDYFKSKDISWELEIEKIDFIVTEKKSRKSKEGGADKHYLWAETKSSVSDDFDMLTQLILTIKKPYDKNEYIIPNYVGCFDTEKIIFVPTKLLLPIFKDNDVKWNIAPNDTKNAYFKKLKDKVIYGVMQKEGVKNFIFGSNDEEIKDFIKKNVIKGDVENKFEITDNNFDRVYLKWVDKVKDTLAVNWEEEKKYGLYDSHFFLADLLSIENIAIRKKLLIILQNDHYKLTKVLKKNNNLEYDDDKYLFKDKQKAYFEFWSIYKRPPLPEFWENILLRQDLLVPQDIREIRGSFFTPQIWVEKSQEYLADVFGNNWQDKYYVWDCCAGTGNLLVGINRKIENVFASTIDEADVKVMYNRIENGAKLLKKNVFKFDFLNDDFKKVPKALKEIIDSPKKREKLIIYINPPYAEASSTNAIINYGSIKEGVSTNQQTRDDFIESVGSAIKELFIQFITRIYKEIPNCKLAFFSKMKFVNSQNFISFRKYFCAEFKKGFLVRADTFDNVVGKFPIGFTIWELNGKHFPKSIKLDVIPDKLKKTYRSDIDKTINMWIKQYNKIDLDKKEIKCVMVIDAPDFQKVHQPFLSLTIGTRHCSTFSFYSGNIIEGCIYFTVRLCIDQTWLNDRDQFLCPNEKWKKDIEFQNDCFIFTLFHGQNRITSADGVNHWIPFTEKEVGTTNKFKSNFMSDYISGKIKTEKVDEFQFDVNVNKRKGKMVFSSEAKDVYNSGLKLWKYYHSKSRVNINASFYDIRAYFQGFKNDKMNNKSTDDEYNTLIGELREKIKILAKKIEPKVFEYGFLLE